MIQTIRSGNWSCEADGGLIVRGDLFTWEEGGSDKLSRELGGQLGQGSAFLLSCGVTKKDSSELRPYLWNFVKFQSRKYTHVQIQEFISE